MNKGLEANSDEETQQAREYTDGYAAAYQQYAANFHNVNSYDHAFELGYDAGAEWATERANKRISELEAALRDWIETEAGCHDLGDGYCHHYYQPIAECSVAIARALLDADKEPG